MAVILEGLEFDLESALKRLEQIILKMERDRLSIEMSLSQFEEGVQLISHCQQLLKKAEQKVNILLETYGQPLLSPYEVSDTSEP